MNYLDIPNRQDTASLGEVALLLHTTDALLEDRGDLGGGGLVGVGAGLDRSDGRSGGASLQYTEREGTLA